jgi:peroxiredoxin
MNGRPVGKGDAFVDFTLTDRAGHLRDTAAARAEAPLLVAFYKVNCPTCQLTMPYLQRLADLYPGLTVWGVSQNETTQTRQFEDAFGVRFPQLLDADLKVTDRYDLLTVPAMYLVDAEGKVIETMACWERNFVNNLGKFAAERTGKPFVPPVPDDDPAPALKPG